MNTQYAIRNFTTNQWVGGDGSWESATFYTAKAPATSAINFEKGLQKYKPWRISTDDLRVVPVSIPEPQL